MPTPKRKPKARTSSTVKAKARAKASTHAQHIRKHKASLVKQGKCRQCGKPRGKKSPSTVRCAACAARHAQQMKKYRHDGVSQAIVKARPQQELPSDAVDPSYWRLKQGPAA